MPHGTAELARRERRLRLEERQQHVEMAQFFLKAGNVEQAAREIQAARALGAKGRVGEEPAEDETPVAPERAEFVFRPEAPEFFRPALREFLGPSATAEQITALPFEEVTPTAQLQRFIEERRAQGVPTEDLEAILRGRRIEGAFQTVQPGGAQLARARQRREFEGGTQQPRRGPSAGGLTLRTPQEMALELARERSRLRTGELERGAELETGLIGTRAEQRRATATQQAELDIKTAQATDLDAYLTGLFGKAGKGQLTQEEREAFNDAVGYSLAKAGRDPTGEKRFQRKIFAKLDPPTSPGEDPLGRLNPLERAYWSRRILGVEPGTPQERVAALVEANGVESLTPGQRAIWERGGEKERISMLKTALEAGRFEFARESAERAKRGEARDIVREEREEQRAALSDFDRQRDQLEREFNRRRARAANIFPASESAEAMAVIEVEERRAINALVDEHNARHPKFKEHFERARIKAHPRPGTLREFFTQELMRDLP